MDFATRVALPKFAVLDLQADVAVLEEPEHLTWFHHGQRWTDAFKHVVGVIHTNYVDYIRRGGGRAASMSCGYLNRRVCCIHCHKVEPVHNEVLK